MFLLKLNVFSRFLSRNQRRGKRVIRIMRIATNIFREILFVCLNIIQLISHTSLIPLPNMFYVEQRKININKHQWFGKTVFEWGKVRATRGKLSSSVFPRKGVEKFRKCHGLVTRLVKNISLLELFMNSIFMFFQRKYWKSLTQFRIVNHEKATLNVENLKVNRHGTWICD